jgi:hypothetical protein
MVLALPPDKAAAAVILLSDNPKIGYRETRIRLEEGLGRADL